ncbi:hypothetical protein BD410DRAFT_842529 [Rickenella mellea]|uniref:Peptidase C14 caspase domain-containing protein n=1 Tax=Rickenella mellea TaxID=50990 RepID=A0A4Y7PUT7_9AGAM|nr:hypothetical protein BD410DRAFT_842529 [Rickenella mellea]
MSSAPVFALVIGINSYQERNRLNGAVADADEFECFLKDRIPFVQIVNLRDAEATRENIKSEFERFQHNEGIKKGDAMIIYFAGHGGRALITEGWAGYKPHDSHMEIICPVDIDVGDGINRKPIGGISDRTLANWLNGISQEKGNNITLILDCCHAAGANRGDDDNTYVPRRMSNPLNISLEDCEAWASDPNPEVENNARGTGVPSAFMGQNQESHVLLAACGQTELAFENNKRGLFTRALLDALEKSDLRTITYKSLIRKIQIPKDKNQNPECQGKYRDRLLFNVHSTRADWSIIRGLNENGTITLHAGGIQGIKLSSHFAIYGSIAAIGSSNSLGFLVVNNVTPTTSILLYPIASQAFTIPPQFYARELPKDPIRVYCADEDKPSLQPMLMKAVCNSKIPSLEAAGVMLVQNEKSAKLRIAIKDSQVSFYRQDEDIATFAGHRIPHTIPIDDSDGILEVLRAANRFQRQLSTTSKLPLVTMELLKLKRDYDFSEGSWVQTPIGTNLIDGDGNVDMPIDPNAAFGVRIHNGTCLRLYPHLFYFDCSDFSIEHSFVNILYSSHWYVPPLGVDGRIVDPPLLPNSNFAIGFGNDGAPPYGFFLPEGEKKDIGFFKLYLTTSPTDLSSISQQSAFETGRGFHELTQDCPDVWGTQLVTVFIRDPNA